MTLIEESILINAPPAQVWATLVDLASWSEWNTFIVSIQVQPPSTKIEVGSSQQITIQPDGSRKTETYSNVTSVFTPERELRWKGNIMADFVFNTVHWCTLESITDEQGVVGAYTKFTQGEAFGGVLSPIVVLSGKATQLSSGYKRMNEDLKSYIENS